MKKLLIFLLLVVLIVLVGFDTKPKDQIWRGYKIPAENLLSSVGPWYGGDDANDVAVKMAVSGLAVDRVYLTIRPLSEVSVLGAKESGWKEYLEAGKPNFVEVFDGYYVFEHKLNTIWWALYRLNSDDIGSNSILHVASCSNFSNAPKSCLFSAHVADVSYTVTLNEDDIAMIENVKQQIADTLQTWKLAQSN